MACCVALACRLQCLCYTEKAPNAWQRRGTQNARNTYNQPNRPNRQTSQTAVLVYNLTGHAAAERLRLPDLPVKSNKSLANPRSRLRSPRASEPRSHLATVAHSIPPGLARNTMPT